jgi:hypothetical protein
MHVFQPTLCAWWLLLCNATVVQWPATIHSYALCVTAHATSIVAAFLPHLIPPPPGQFSTSSTSVSGPNSFYWQGGYWGYCPPPGPLTAAAPAIPIPQNPGGALAGGGTGTVALIRSPQINMEFQTNDARGLAPVLLDAQGTQAGAGRNIVSMQAELGAGVREIKGPWRSAWLCQVYLATTSWSLQPLSCRNSCFPPSPRVCQPCCQPNGCIS